MPIVGSFAGASARAYGLGAGLAAPVGFNSIATTIVDSVTSTITFDNIPAQFTHLQIRWSFISTLSGVSPYLRFNSDTGSNYAYHEVHGTGASAVSYGVGTQSTMYIAGSETGSSTTAPMVGITDILDYADTNKNTTLRTISGVDQNGSGEAQLYGGHWRNTSAITKIEIIANVSTFKQYSIFALYGIKG